MVGLLLCLKITQKVIFFPSNLRIAAAPSDCRFAAHDGCSASAAAGAARAAPPSL